MSERTEMTPTDPSVCAAAAKPASRPDAERESGRESGREPERQSDCDRRGPVPALLLQALAGLRGIALRLALASAAINLLMLAPTLYMLQVYDRVMVSMNPWTLVAVSLVTLALLLVMAQAESWRTRWQVRCGLALEQRLSAPLFRAAAVAGLNPMSAPGAQPLQDLTTLRQFLSGPGVNALFDTPWTPIYLVVLWLLHPQLAAAALVFLLLQLGLAVWSQHLSARPAAAANDAARSEQQLLRDSLRHGETVEALGMAAALRGHWRRRRALQRSLAEVQQDQLQRLGSLSRWLRQVQQSASLAVGAWLVIHGQLSPGAMIAANVLMTRALAPVDALVGVWKLAHAAHEAWQRLVQLLARSPQPAYPGAQALPEPAGHLVFDAVSAQVPGRAAALLDRVDLVLAPGSITALIGPSGAGKSTLARMAVGLWPPSQGRLTLDGQALSGQSADALGRHIGYLPQDLDLLDGSVADNIARFRQPDPTQVVAAAQACGLHELILRLPKGYDTPVGEGGHGLSGGMRQRIALARAVYGAPRLVVLDEPNANLDEAGEAALARLLCTLKAQGCTLLIVSHRPAVLSVVDRLVVLNAGRVRHDGPRDEVLAALRAAQTGRPAPAAPTTPSATPAAVTPFGRGPDLNPSLPA